MDKFTKMVCLIVISIWLACDPYIEGRVPLWFETVLSECPGEIERSICTIPKDQFDTTYADDGEDAYVLELDGLVDPGTWFHARVRACDDGACSEWSEEDLYMPGDGEEEEDDGVASGGGGGGGCFIGGAKR